MKLLRLTLLTAATLSFSAVASAQSAYVGATLFGDVVRSTHTDTGGVTGPDGGGEAIGFALRVGTRVGATWGVDLEFARPAAIEGNSAPQVQPLAGQPGGTSPGFYTVTPSSATLIFPPIGFSIEAEERHTTLSPSAWIEQQLSARVSLVYLGGLTFGRTEREYTVSYPSLAGVPLVRPSYTSATTTYGLGAVVGFESRLGLGERAQLVPGIRLHAIDNTWLVRPSVGISWNF
jgi:hypothetical protein